MVCLLFFNYLPEKESLRRKGEGRRGGEGENSLKPASITMPHAPSRLIIFGKKRKGNLLLRRGGEGKGEGGEKKSVPAKFATIFSFLNNFSRLAFVRAHMLQGRGRTLGEGRKEEGKSARFCLFYNPSFKLRTRKRGDREKKGEGGRGVCFCSLYFAGRGKEGKVIHGEKAKGRGQHLDGRGE